MSERQQKALAIAAKSKIAKKGDVWLVPSQAGNGQYKVNATDPDWPTCTCPDFELRHARCKHIYAVEIVIERERSVTEMTHGDTTTTTVTETVKVTKRVTYKQEWTAYNQAQTNEKHLFESLLHDLCSGIVEPFQKMGRPRLQYKDMLFSSAFKVYCGMSARRFNTDFCEAQVKGHVSKAAHFNSVNRYLANPALTSLLRDLITYSSLPLKAIESDFAVDSSGFSTCQYVRWFDAKYGKEVDAHDWIKVHLMTGVKTHIVTSVEITDRNSNDCPHLPGLVKQTANNFTVKEVSGDKGYSSLDNHEAIASVGATPYIAFKSNTTGAVGGLFEKMFHFYSYKRAEFLTAYHKRSNVETTFSMVKAKFGGHIRSKSETAQINTDKNLFIVSSMPRLYQQVFSGVANYSALGNRIIHKIKAAHAFRQVEQVRELSRILINIPIKEYQLIAQYYLVWCKCREYQYPAKVLENIIEETHTYKTKAIFSRAAIEIYQGNLEHALYFYGEAFKTSPTVSEYIDLARSIAGLKSLEGFHQSALKDLEKLIPLIKHAEPRLYYDFLNSYAVELSESGRKDEARNIIRHVISSPFAPAYPEWQDTANDLREPNRSFVAIPSITREPVGIETTEIQHASEPKKSDKVVAFPPLKAAPEPEMPEPLTPQEIREMSLIEKRDLIIAAIRASQMSEFEYNKLIVLLGLLKRGPADKELDLEDEETLDDIAVIWAVHVEPENFAAVLSALRDCDDSSRRNEIIDRMIKKAFQQTHLTRLSEEAWRLEVERRLPEK